MAGTRALWLFADHRVNTRQCGQVKRSPLGVAASDQDASGGVFAVDAAQKGTGRPVSLRGDTAGVGDDHIGSARAGCRAHAPLAQAGADHLAIRATGATAKVFYVIFCHVAILEQTNVVSGRIQAGRQPPVRPTSIYPGVFVHETSHSFGR